MGLRITRILGIHAVKGGSGATTLAANLSSALRREGLARVACGEAGASVSGDLAVLLGDDPDGSSRHTVTRLPADEARSTDELRSAFDVTVLDLSGRGPEIVGIFDACDLVLLVVRPDLLSIRRVRALAGAASDAHLAPGRFRIVLSCSDEPGAMKASDLRPLLPYPILATVPSDAAVLAAALASGQPAVAAEPSAAFSKAVRALAVSLLSDGAWPTARPGRSSLRVARPGRPAASPAAAASGPDAAPRTRDGGDRPGDGRDLGREWHAKVHAALPQHVDLRRVDLSVRPDEKGLAALRADIVRAASTILTELGLPETDRETRERLAHEVADEAMGLGPIEPLLRDPSVSEVMVVGAGRIFVERAGRIEASGAAYSSDAHLRTAIERIVAPIGRRVDESQPLVDARLPDGSRVHVVLPPLSLCGPVLTIRKFPDRRFSLDDLVSAGTLPADAAAFLSACVAARCNLVVSGGTGSGKTTLLNALSAAIPAGERIVTIEDAAELRLQQPHVVTLESRPPNLEGKGEVPIRELVRNALRMRPDRIVVGECRGGEALDMLQAMNTGHDGSLTTAHANSPRELVSRLETMVLMSGMELPVRAIREQIAGAIQVIVQQVRLAEGARRVTHITEVAGLEGDRVVLQDIFGYEEGMRTAVSGAELRATGLVPAFAARLERAGFARDRLTPAATGNRR